MSKIGQCKECLFWKVPEPGDGPEGRCRRYAPRPTDIVKIGTTGWPYTKGKKFCGERAPKTSE